MRSTVLFLVLAGCPPWITPQRHDDNNAPEPQVHTGLLRADLEADAACVESGAGTTWHVGEVDVSGGTASGLEQLVVIAHPDWSVEGAPAEDCWHQFETEGSATGDYATEGLTVDLDATWQAAASNCDLTRFYVAPTMTRSWRAQAPGLATGGLYATLAGDQPVGEAEYDAGKLTYTAGPTCIWPHATN